MASSVELAVTPRILSLPMSFLASCTPVVAVSVPRRVDKAGVEKETSFSCQMKRTHIILANMNSLAPNLNSHVHAVIDEQRHAILLRQGVQAAGHVDDEVLVAVLVAVLDNGGAAPERGLDDVGQALVAEDGGRRVGDEVDAVVWCWLGHGGLVCACGCAKCKWAPIKRVDALLEVCSYESAVKKSEMTLFEYIWTMV